MADSSAFNSALEENLCYLRTLGMPLVLRPEQREAIWSLVLSRDLLAVLPTGFGKSLIFQLLVRVQETLCCRFQCVIVVCPLKSIVQDQLIEASAMGLSAVALTSARLEDVERGNYRLIFASAEEVLAKPFLASLKKTDTPFHQNLAAIIVDESHTVETWTGQRSNKTKKGKKADAFRECFGKLGELRSFCKQGTPMGALTGTADPTTQETIKRLLCLKNCKTIYVSPNRLNLRFSVKKVKKDVQLKELLWLVNLVKEEGVNCPKTIVFCNTMNEIAIVVNYLISELGRKVFHPQFCPQQDNCLIGIYHSNSWQSCKDRVLNQFKTNGVKRILVATTALCMGVNFPDVRYIINWGPARTILDQHQEAGRAGRDGKKSHVIVIYHGQQVSHCEQEVKDFVRTKGCFRVAAYKTLDATIQPLEPLHDCCSFCTSLCKCASGKCSADVLPFETVFANEKDSGNHNGLQRQVKPGEREVLREALHEVWNGLRSERVSLDASSSHGFSTQLIDDITHQCEIIFNLHDLVNNFPVFSVANALRILEVIQEIFMDIPNFEETLAFLNWHSNKQAVNVPEFDFDSIDLGFMSDRDSEDEL